MSKKKGNKGAIAVCLIIGFVIAIIFSLISAAQVKSTSTVEFCNSCHEMNPFYETWAMGPHGLDNKGAIKARCVDCHLPHDSLVNYLVTKTKAGLHDMQAHWRGKKTEWLKLWKNRGPYVHEAYESGCKECHKNIIAPGIPTKAISAHKAYLSGQTERDCIDCHYLAGHGDLVQVFRDLGYSE